VTCRLERREPSDELYKAIKDVDILGTYTKKFKIDIGYDVVASGRPNYGRK
jgi:hypothetical protein